LRARCLKPDFRDGVAQIKKYFLEETVTDSVIVKNIEELKAVERHIVYGIATGMTNREIAWKLGIKTGTVRNYISRILHKTGLQHRTQIAIFAFENGVGPDSETCWQ
jgi:DNA-binding NarL/FixJ family response regulator